MPREQPELVVAVPASPGRRPGPHFAYRLAKLAAQRLGVPWRRDLLRPTRIAAEQHRLDRQRRRRNVEGLYACRGPIPSRILLVDDLITTGATATAAASALGRAGAEHIELLALARTWYRRAG